MFYCHALEKRRFELIKKGDKAAVTALPVVTCFERAPGPGGIWRAERSFDPEERSDQLLTPSETSADEKESREPESTDRETTTNMYEALWTNGPKETIEFYDHTYDEHFGCALPVYMPRQLILDYMIGRVTKNCQSFFEKYFQFNTSVESVKYNDETKLFEIATTDMNSGKTLTSHYDKCIWAAGECGRPIMPAPLVQLF